jgi:predicted acyltransferase
MESTAAGTGTGSAPPSNAANRLMSLDVFRGATIAAMILVNDAGDGASTYWPLRHSHWNGWTPTDLVFPFFVFIVGVAMAFSFRSRQSHGETRGKLFLHVLWRGVVLFALGLFVNGFPNHFHPSSLRIYGVLQRIALCYVITSVLALWTGRRTQIAVAAACVIGYWIVMRYLPVPGFGVPTRDIPLLDPDRNMVAWLDRKLLWGHLYERVRDPEGLLSTVPAVATCVVGLLTGSWLRSYRSVATKLAGMVACGLVLLTAGKIWNIWFPINKKLWTSSYVLFTAGLALLCLAVCYWVLDIRQWRGRWTKPFLVFGMNAIAAYVLSEAIADLLDNMRLTAADGQILSWQEVIYERLFEPLASPANASLLYAIAYVVVCWAVMWVLYRKKIFLKV